MYIHIFAYILYILFIYYTKKEDSGEDSIKDKKNVDFISKIRFINLSNVNSVTRIRTHNVFSSCSFLHFHARSIQNLYCKHRDA